MKNALRLAIVLAALGLGLGLTACETSEPGVTNTFGTITDDAVPGTPPQIVDTTKQVVDELKLVLVSAQATELDGKVVARTANDRDITMTIYKKGESASQVNIRAGWTGDEGTALTILRKVKQKLDGGAVEAGASEEAVEGN